MGRLFYIYTMKKVMIALLCIVLRTTTVSAQTQTDSLSFDENNKYIYYQVASQPSLSADTLYKRALFFLQTAYPNDKLKLSKEDKSKATLKGKGGFFVSKKALVSMHEDAKITYNIVIEVKDGKYRYWLTDFVVIPYERDRYANFVPVLGKDVPLEHGRRKLGQKTLDDYLEKVLVNCRAISNKFKSFIANPSSLPKEIKTKSVTTKEW